MCRLKKALYGPKQSPWGMVLKTHKGNIVLRLQAKPNRSHFVFQTFTKGKLSVLLIYVDDIIVTGDDSTERQQLKEKLSTEIEMKDLRQLKYFLGI